MGVYCFHIRHRCSSSGSSLCHIRNSWSGWTITVRLSSVSRKRRRWCACVHCTGGVSGSINGCLTEEYEAECCLHWCEEVLLKSRTISSVSLTLRERLLSLHQISAGWLILVSEEPLCCRVISRFNDMIALMCGDAGLGQGGGRGAGGTVVTVWGLLLGAAQQWTQSGASVDWVCRCWVNKHLDEVFLSSRCDRTECDAPVKLFQYK